MRQSLRAIDEEDYEFLFIIDGPTDNSVDVLLGLKATEPNIRIVELSRNFGHHKALMTGISLALGNLVFVIDCDLEEPPELLERFFDELKTHSSDVVYGVQEKRKGKLFERLFGDVFYRLYNRLADMPIDKNILMARLMTRRYVDGLLQFRERALFLGGVFALVGFDQRAVSVKKGKREGTTYTLRKRIGLMVDAITGSTHRLLKYVFYLGIFISFISFTLSLVYLITAVFISDFMTGWPSLILSIWMLSGLIILCLGIIGMYVSKMFEEIKQRPLTVIKREL